MERRLREMFDYQRFENNSRLSSMLSDALERYGFSNEGEISDEEAELLNAAGTTANDPRPDREKSL